MTVGTLAAQEADRLENVLREAENDYFFTDVRRVVKAFCKVHIWPLYVSAVQRSNGLTKISEALRAL
jgi:hypothetical protein